MGHIGVEIFTTGILYSLKIRKLITVGSWIQKHRRTTGYDGQPIPKRQRVLSEQSQPQPEHDETSPLIARQPLRKPPSSIPRTPPRHTQILPEPNSQNNFLSGLPFIENRGSYLPSVPRSKRFPQPSRAQRLTKLTSHLRNDSQPHQQSIPGGGLRKSHTSRPGPYDRHLLKNANRKLNLVSPRSKTMSINFVKDQINPTRLSCQRSPGATKKSPLNSVDIIVDQVNDPHRSQSPIPRRFLGTQRLL